MSVLGIIAEYNPFHLGHKYQIKKALEISGCNCVIAVMSGNYVQRGTPAFYPKYDRARHAIENGADLVIELPTVYSCSTAEIFAESAVITLAATKIVDAISFGCECDNLHYLNKLADILNQEPEPYKNYLKERLALGESYPRARQAAIEIYTGNKDLAAILSSPNNILAIEYIKAIKKYNLKFDVYPVKRTDNGYNSLKLTDNFSSSSAIRQAIISQNSSLVETTVPENVFNYISTNPNYLSMDDYQETLIYNLLKHNSFACFAEANTELSNRILNLSGKIGNLDFICNHLLTKNETKAHILRLLLHILLDIKKSDIEDFRTSGFIYYFNILGSNSNGMKLISQINCLADIPTVIQFGKFLNSEHSKVVERMLEINIFADKLYDNLYYQKSGIWPINDFSLFKPL